MNKLVSIIYYINLISSGLAVISFFCMLSYLYKRGYTKSQHFSINPLFFFKYIEVTKTETGKIGIWFKIFVTTLTIALGSVIPLTIGLALG